MLNCSSYFYTTGFATTSYDCIATTTQMATHLATTFFNSFLNLLTQILPYGIGLLMLFIGWHLGRRALGGR